MFINDGAKIRFFQEHIFDFQINNFVLLRPKTQKKDNESLSKASITYNP